MSTSLQRREFILGTAAVGACVGLPGLAAAAPVEAAIPPVCGYGPVVSLWLDMPEVIGSCMQQLEPYVPPESYASYSPQVGPAAKWEDLTLMC